MLRLPFNLFGRSLSRHASVVRSIDDAAQLGVPVLGSVSEFDPRPGARLPGDEYPEALEAYRRLADAVRLPDFHVRGRAIVVTSAVNGAGKSTVAKNLATLLSRGGSKVILVDANLNRVARRRPGDGTSSSGFAGLLVNQLMRPGNAVVHTMDSRLKLLPVGSTTGAADALLQSPRLPRVVEGLRDLADYVIFDVATVTHDLPHLTRFADVTLIVLRSGGTSRKEASRAVATLRESSAGLMGTVLNRAPVVIAAPEVRPPMIKAPKLRAMPVPVDEAAESKAAPEKRLEIAVDDLLADLEGALRLIRDLRQVEDEPEDDMLDGEVPVEEEDAELVTMDR
jgi:Mrp family chromosome partitioning ATPase